MPERKRFFSIDPFPKVEQTSKLYSTRQNGATTFQSLMRCTWPALRTGYLVQLMLVTKARSWHQVVLLQLVNGSNGLARVFNSSTIVDCARHSPLIAGNPSTSGGEIETADCEIWSAAAFRLLYSQCSYCCLILFPIHILLFYSQFYFQYCNVYIVVWF